MAPSVFNTGTGQLLPSSLLKQRYRVLSPIGQGGMGAVYEAEDTQLGNRKVALKEMRQSGLSPQEIKDAADAFRQEALLLAGLQNPHLPNIYDHFSEFGRWYLVMSFIHGETLEAYLGKAGGGRLPLEEALQVGIQLCTVLGYLHTQQPPIIFRDLKPANIMHTADGHIYLIDFGIARLFKPGQARDTSTYGSMGYAAPEQYGKAQTTPQSDIFSLGVVLHQLLTGYHPSSSPFRFPALAVTGQVFPVELVALVEQMHNLDDTNRPVSILVVKQKLQRIAAGSAPAKATPLPPTIPSKVPQVVSLQTPQLMKKPASVVAVKPVGIWSIGRRQVAAMVIGIVLTGIGDYLTDLPNIPVVSVLAFLIPLFFATKFGPWVGVATALIGIFIGDSIAFGFANVEPSWFYYMSLVPFGLLAGLALSKTRGRNPSRGAIGFATMMSFIALLVYELITLIVAIIVLHESLSFAFSNLQPWYIVIPLILLPLLLFISGKIEDRRANP